MFSTSDFMLDPRMERIYEPKFITVTIRCSNWEEIKNVGTYFLWSCKNLNQPWTIIVNEEELKVTSKYAK